jgi:hypothetical protein
LRKSALIIPGLVLAYGLLAACNLVSNVITEKLPVEPTVITTPTSLTPIVIPVILPPTTTLPPPPPTTQVPAPGPTPNPGPAPPPTSNGCNLPGQSPATSCTYQAGQFAGDIEWAIDQVINSKPQFFDLTDQRGYRSPKVLNEQGYTNSVVQALGGRGFCAVWDGEEIAIKNVQAYNEQYDILTASGYVRRGPGAYRSTCRPAWF